MYEHLCIAKPLHEPGNSSDSITEPSNEEYRASFSPLFPPKSIAIEFHLKELVAERIDPP